MPGVIKQVCSEAKDGFGQAVTKLKAGGTQRPLVVALDDFRTRVDNVGKEKSGVSHHVLHSASQLLSSGANALKQVDQALPDCDRQQRELRGITSKFLRTMAPGLKTFLEDIAKFVSRDDLNLQTESAEAVPA